MGADNRNFEQKKEEIAAAALKIFAARGYRGATNATIAKAAGISPGLLYWYFKNKEDLFSYTFSRSRPLSELMRVLDDLEGQPLERVLRQAGLAFFRTFLDPEMKMLLQLFFKEAGRTPEQAGTMLDQGRLMGFGALAKHLGKAVANGEVRPIDIPVAVQMFLGTLMSFVMMYEIVQMKTEETFTPERIVETVVAIFLQGVAKERE